MITMNNLKGSGAKFFGAGSSSSSPVSWDDLTDKPFGEVPDKEIHWPVDNLEDQYSVNTGEKVYYHVSGETPTYEQFKDGADLFLSDETGEIEYSLPGNVIVEMDEMIVMGAVIMIIPRNNFETMGFVFEKKGIYVCDAITDGSYAGKIASGIIIPGYLKTIDEKFLPDWVLALKPAT